MADQPNLVLRTFNTWSHAPDRINHATAAPPDPGDREQVISEVLRLVAGGTYLRDACEAAGISRDTFLDWRLRDATLSQRYFEARASWALVRMDDAMEQLAHASTPVAATRWRAILQAVQWESERLLLQYRKAADDPVGHGDAAKVIKIIWERDAPAIGGPILDLEAEPNREG